MTTIAAVLLAACGGGDAPRPDPAADTVTPAPAASLAPAPAGQAPATAADSAAPAAQAADTPADSAIAAEGAKERRAAQEDYTQWRALELPSEPWAQSAADPRALLTRVRDVVAAQLEEPDASVLPTRMLTQSADSAVGLLVHPDQADDSVRDVEFRIHMRPEGSQWTVSAVERRERCRRGVAEGGLCA